MTNPRRHLVHLVCLVASMTSACLAADVDFDAVKEAIQSRSHQIQSAKARGEFSEGADGLLVASSTTSAQAAELMRTENDDRKRMFELIAARSGQDAGTVAGMFAQKAALAPAAMPPAMPTAPEKPAEPVADAPFVPVKPGSRIALRVLTRPLAAMHESPAADSPVQGGSPQAFSALAVLSRENGWYQVADQVGGRAKGWMNEKDVIEWKHNLVACFTHPDGRNRAVVFKDKSTLEDLAKKAPDQRTGLVKRFQDALSPGGTDVPAEVLGGEPEGWARMQNQFFILPVLDQEMVEIDGRDARILHIAAAARERGSFNPADFAPPDKTPAAPKIDLVFVMDLTKSMRPFIARTREMLMQIAGSLSGQGIADDAVEFGLWGYRDDPELCKGIEFNTHNFTPEMQPLASFTQTLESVNVTEVDSIDYAEDVLAGVADAIKNTKWRDGAVKMILLVGDAPGREQQEVETECEKRPRPKGTASGMNVNELRSLADAESVGISSIYLEAPQWKHFTSKGEHQFRPLGVNPSSDLSAGSYTLVDAVNPDAYDACARDFASRMAENLRQMAAGKPLPSSGPVPSGKDNPAAAGRQMADNVFRSAMIEWLSSQKKLPVPRDIDGWVLDKDPENPAKTSLEASVLLNRDQLDSLKRMTDDLVNAAVRSQISSEDFFTALQAVVATGARDPSRLRSATTLQQAGMIPDFLDGLPYKSQVMGFSKEVWRDMSGDAQDQFIRNVESKLRYYEGIYEDVDKWTKINPNDDEAGKVYAVPLKNLP